MLYKISAILFPLLFILLGFFVCSGALDPLNQMVYQLIRPTISTGLTKWVIAYTHTGSAFSLIAVVVWLLIHPATRFKYGVPCGFSLSISAIANHIIKNIYAIERPMEFRLIPINGYSFPSGHVMNSTALFFCLMLLFINQCPYPKRKIAVIFITSIHLLIMAFSRIYLGVHTFADTIGGGLVGVFLSIVILLFSKTIAKKDKL